MTNIAWTICFVHLPFCSYCFQDFGIFNWKKCRCAADTKDLGVTVKELELFFFLWYIASLFLYLVSFNKIVKETTKIEWDFSMGALLIGHII